MVDSVSQVVIILTGRKCRGSAASSVRPSSADVQPDVRAGRHKLPVSAADDVNGFDAAAALWRPLRCRRGHRTRAAAHRDGQRRRAERRSAAAATPAAATTPAAVGTTVTPGAERGGRIRRSFAATSGFFRRSELKTFFPLCCIS